MLYMSARKIKEHMLKVKKMENYMFKNILNKKICLYYIKGKKQTSRPKALLELKKIIIS